MAISTARLVIRHPEEDDRARFVELFTSEEFMVYSGAHDVESANARFDHMVDMASVLPYAKQAVVDRLSGIVVGYTGADMYHVEGVDRLEWGWRLTVETRGQGLATEAVAALLALADTTDDGEMLCLIHPDNEASHRVALKVGFQRSQRVHWMGDPPDAADVLTRAIGSGGPPLVACHRAS